MAFVAPGLSFVHDVHCADGRDVDVTYVLWWFVHTPYIAVMCTIEYDMFPSIVPNKGSVGAEGCMVQQRCQQLSTLVKCRPRGFL
jgi:hypothetical protein